MGLPNRAIWIGLLAALGLAGGALVATNPAPPAYEQYAVKTLSDQLETRLCSDIPPLLSEVLGSCSDLLAQHQSSLQELVRSQSQRRNFWLFSLYRTTLAVPGLPMLPAYQVDTLGIFNQFLTYRAVQR
jgi:Domain of unknown function (DUF4359)